ncbi:DUF1749-domain-containing protein [Viridothelium virens]|uniref:DUF1749-domain-containing protein n=1 Tax=Viridothelium virens TaxID=1048519 RepID=A0A6A6H6D9_VIRVR|nr:DUF1749-domain-containing protein [Viridothelium virens]
MASPAFEPSAHQGTLHHITQYVYAFEYAPQSSSASTISPHKNILLFPTSLAAHLPPHWRLARLALSSSGEAWGTKSLRSDAEEILKCVRYFRSLYQASADHGGGGDGDRGEGGSEAGGKVVLMGHSTGCQDIMEYLVGGSNATLQHALPSPPFATTDPIDGAILQAPASDREGLAITTTAEQLSQAIASAREFVAKGRPRELLSRELTREAFGPAPLSAARFLAVVSPGPEHEGEDDYFSSDFGAERLEATFGKVPVRTRLLVLYSGKDEYVPVTTDKGALVGRWRRVVKEKGGTWDEDGGVIEGAKHGVDGEGNEPAVEDLCSRVVGMLGRVEGRLGGHL